MKSVSIVLAFGLLSSSVCLAGEEPSFVTMPPGVNTAYKCVVNRTLIVQDGHSATSTTIMENYPPMGITIEPGFELKGPIKLELCDLKLTIGKP